MRRVGVEAKVVVIARLDAQSEIVVEEVGGAGGKLLGAEFAGGEVGEVGAGLFGALGAVVGDRDVDWAWWQKKRRNLEAAPV